MLLLTNGCSWTWGGGLETFTKNVDKKRLDFVWPTHLGKMLGANYVINLSMGCGSNQRILRTTIDYLINFKKIDNITAVIQFTDPSRYEYYVTNRIHDFTNSVGSWARTNNNTVITLEKDLDHAKERVKNRLETYTDIEGMYITLTQTLALVKLLELYNAKYYFWHPFGTLKFYSEPYKSFFLQFPTLDSECVYDYARVSIEDSHPSILGHKQIAELIYNDIKLLASPQIYTSLSYNDQDY